MHTHIHVIFHATVIVNYARQMYPSSAKTVSSSVASAAIAQAQWSMVRTTILSIQLCVVMSVILQQSLAMMKASKQSQAVTQPQVQQVILKSSFTLTPVQYIRLRPTQ